MAKAEIVKLRSGQTVEGKILKQEKNNILMDVGVGTPVTYFRDEIKEILPDVPSGETAVGFNAQIQADVLETKAVEHIDAGRMDQGLDLFRQAIELDPAASRHMNYGSVLFGNGVSLFKKGQMEQAQETLRHSQEELKKSIAGFDKNKDAAFMSQAYYLLGEIALNALSDTSQAKQYYQQALKLFDHGGAKAALAKL